AAGCAGGTLPCAMNAANEVAVAAFLAGQCAYLSIADCVEAVMEAHHGERVTSVEQLAQTDATARQSASNYLAKLR
ncbi:MAG: 1-deoxy-D-xylulose-5-phosphate reductoisomerase, partial [Raoultibacter sp.]